MNNQLEKELNQAYPEGLTWQKSVPTFHVESADEAADIFKRVADHKDQVYISGFGNNIDPIGDKFEKLLVLKTDRLNHIIEVNRDDFFITVGAGYPLIEINHTLKEEKLWFPFGDTLYPGSFGGALASGLTAFDGAHDLPLMRSLLEVEAVLPDGSIVRPGAKTFKSVSGYDISRLFFNSWGVLGMVTHLSFRVLPLRKKDENYHLVLKPADYDRFKKDVKSDTPLGNMCRKVKSEYDPANLLPIL